MYMNNAYSTLMDNQFFTQYPPHARHSAKYWGQEDKHDKTVVLDLLYNFRQERL